MHAKQVELASVPHKLREIRSFHKDATSTNQQNKIQHCIFLWKLFSKMIHVLSRQQCSFVLSSRYQAHVDQMSETDVARTLHPT